MPIGTVDVFNSAITRLSFEEQSRALSVVFSAVSPAQEQGLVLARAQDCSTDDISGDRAGALVASWRVACLGPDLLTGLPCPLQVFHYMSIAILTFFMIEIFFKLFVFRLEFFHHKFEILDSVVVVVSFVIDIVFLLREHDFEALGLLILLRLWRVARIINGTSPALLGCRADSGQPSATLGRSQLCTLPAFVHAAARQCGHEQALVRSLSAQ